MGAGSTAASHASLPLSVPPAKGYDIRLVDEFLARAKASFEGTGTGDAVLTSAELRRASFPLKKRGYEPRFVDAALDRLEEVFFERERRGFIREKGAGAWKALVLDLERDIRGRIARPHGSRFTRRSVFAHGYRCAQVDAVLDRIANTVDEGGNVAAGDVRGVRFHLQQGGYDEAQVDAFLDAVVEYLLAGR